jgi:hypothetical protein
MTDDHGGSLGQQRARGRFRKGGLASVIGYGKTHRRSKDAASRVES